MKERIPFHVRPMLATLVGEPFDRPGWIYEEKYDGDRILAYKDGRGVRLVSRNAKDRTDRFPAIAAAVSKLPAKTLVLDGEAVVFDKKGVSHFQSLQEGIGHPVYVVFDCLYRDGKDYRRETLSARQAAMRRVLRTGPDLRPAQRLAENGLKAFAQAKRAGLEGLVAKDSSSPYVEARSPLWLKVKIHREDEFVIAGFTSPAGSRQYFGALLLGVYEKKELRYVGKVGTGFDRKRLASLYRQFRPLIIQGCPFTRPPPGKHVTFLAPKLVAQISYQEITADKKLRQPVFLGLRADKRAKDVTLPIPQS